MNRFANTGIGSAAAQIAAHGLIDIRVGWIRLPREKRSGGHDLSGLAVPALRHINFDPRTLNGMAGIR